MHICKQMYTMSHTCMYLHVSVIKMESASGKNKSPSLASNKLESLHVYQMKCSEQDFSTCCNWDWLAG